MAPVVAGTHKEHTVHLHPQTLSTAAAETGPMAAPSDTASWMSPTQDDGLQKLMIVERGRICVHQE